MSISDKSIAFGIVLYQESLYNSVSFNSLVLSIEEFILDPKQKISIIVFDNTPSSNKESKPNSSFNYSQSIDVLYFTENLNKGLAYAYNYIADVARKMSKEWLVLLDQDTELPLEFYKIYKNADTDFKVFCPLIESNNTRISPARYINFRGYDLDLFGQESIPLKEVTCINSGLMINLQLMQKVDGYNEGLFLDFCDHDFILRLKNYGVTQIGILNILLKQDFSSYSHSLKQATARYVQFVKDLKVFRRDKNKWKIFLFVDASRLLSLTMKFKSLKFFNIRLKS